MADHAHHHDHAHPIDPGSRALPLALSIILGFAAIEALAGWLSGSLALLSDAGHMVTDAFALALAALAARLARSPVSDRHSYGLRRLETLAGLFNALVMLLLVGVIVWHAVLRLMDPQPVQGGIVMIVALIGLILNIGVAWILSRGDGSINTRAALLHVIGDLLGSLAALTAGIVIHFTGWYPIDPLLSVLICGLILAATLRLLRAAVHTLLDGVPTHLSLTEIGQRMAATEGVREVHDLHIWSLDSRHEALSAHVTVTHRDNWPEVLERLKHMLKEHFGIDHVTLQPEIPPAKVIQIARASSRGGDDAP